MKDRERKLRLHELVLLVRSLYPTHRSVNPYAKETHRLIGHLSLPDQELFKGLLHSLTVLNQNSYGSSPLLSTQPELLQTLGLLLPERYRLTPVALSDYTRLKEVYGGEYFTYVQAASRLKRSLTTIKRRVRVLEFHQLVAREYAPGGKAWLRLEAPAGDSLETFETMQGEWKDYVGFVSF